MEWLCYLDHLHTCILNCHLSRSYSICVAVRVIEAWAMRLTVVTAVLLLVGALNTVTADIDCKYQNHHQRHIIELKPEKLCFLKHLCSHRSFHLGRVSRSSTHAMWWRMDPLWWESLCQIRQDCKNFPGCTGEKKTLNPSSFIICYDKVLLTLFCQHISVDFRTSAAAPTVIWYPYTAFNRWCTCFVWQVITPLVLNPKLLGLEPKDQGLAVNVS